MPASTPGLRLAWAALGATLMECGATSVGASGERVSNQCFYLALAAAASPPGASIHAEARGLRRRIEAAVREARPGWSDADLLGREVGAFADFLVWGLSSTPLLAGRAVAVYNAPEGSCEIFRPPGAGALSRPVLAICHVPGQAGHYLWVRWGGAGGHPRLPRLLGLHRAGPANAPAVPTLVTSTAG